LSYEVLFIVSSIIVLIGGLLFINIVINKTKIQAEIFRKFLHIVAGLISILALSVVKNEYILVIISFFITLLLLIIKHKKVKYLEITNGMISFSFAYTILLIFFGNIYREIVGISIFILTISDSAAAILGSSLSTNNYNISGDKKSFIGSFSFFISTFLLLLLVPVYTHIFSVLTYDLTLNVVVAFVLSLQLTLIEAISGKGYDNFFIPLYAAYFLFLLINPVNTLLIDYMLIGIVLSTIVVLLSIKARFLTISGGVATFLLANIIFGLGGIKWTVPILTFFVLSSLLSKMKSNNKEKAELYYEKTGVRDYKQVFANGGIPGILLMLNTVKPDELFFLMYIVFLATVCSDTWSTEIGTFIKTNTYNVINFKLIPPGMSGGISFIGTIGGITGSIVITLVSFSFTSYNLFYFFLIILISSFLGNISDSILGATIQGGYNCSICNKSTERRDHCGKPSIITKGYKLITNDIVNLFAGFLSIFYSLIIYYLIFI